MSLITSWICLHIFRVTLWICNIQFESSDFLIWRLTFAIFANVFALKGDIRQTCAHFVKSICRIGSPRWFQRDHSSWSVKISTYSGTGLSLRKYLAFSVKITRICKSCYLLVETGNHCTCLVIYCAIILQKL